MFHLTTLTDSSPLYRGADEAHRLLGRWTILLQQRQIILIDYLLLPTSLELLLFSPAFSTSHTTEELLSLFGRLGRMGRVWQYSGTWELFHKSRCYAQLGKCGCPPLPCSLDQIIAAKEAYLLRSNQSA
jgi:hypothetical protein